MALRQRASWGVLLRYGLLALPLAFVTLPLYVFLPMHYARDFGLSLSALGAILLATRGLDAVIDPLLGRWVDSWLNEGRSHVARVAVGSAAVLSLAFAGLMFPWSAVRAAGVGALQGWAAAMLVLTMLCFSMLSLLHQAWGTRWGGPAAERARINAAREGMALVGVLLASALPRALGWSWTCAALTLLLALGVWSLLRSPAPFASARLAPPARSADAASPVQPWRVPAFRRLYAAYMINGVASAVPSVLVLFFIQDQLQAPEWVGPCLFIYFLSAALSVPLWTRAVRRLRVERAWGWSMGLAVAAFVWTLWLRPGDTGPFALICAVTGLALGADLILPATLLGGLILQAGHASQGEGRYWGWWNVATKLNLALAAGLALPLLGWAGYAPGVREPQALAVLTWTYALVPCVFKVAAMLLVNWAGKRASVRSLREGYANV